jgi:hypothetical protein
MRVRDRIWGGDGSCPPEKLNRQDCPVMPIIRDVVAQTSGLAMGQVIATDHVHGRGVQPSEPGHLQDHAADARRTVDHSPSGRYPAVRERMHFGHHSSESMQQSFVRIPSLLCQVIAQGLCHVHEWLLELRAEDHLADRSLEVLVRRGG